MASTGLVTDMTLQLYNHSNTAPQADIKVYSELMNTTALPWSTTVGARVQVYSKEPGTPDRTFNLVLTEDGVGDTASVTSATTSATAVTFNVNVGTACTAATLITGVTGAADFTAAIAAEFGLLALTSGLLGVSSGTYTTAATGIVLPGKAYTVMSSTGAVTIPMTPFGTYKVTIEYTNDFSSSDSDGPNNATDVKLTEYTTLKIPQHPGNGATSFNTNLFSYLDI